MKITSRGTAVERRKNTDMVSNIFPGICVLESGRWLLGWRAGPSKHCRLDRVLARWSDDEGKTWSEPREPFKPIKLAGKPSTWRGLYMSPLGGDRVLAAMTAVDYSEPFKPMFNEATEGLVDMKNYWAVSRDGGETFSAPKPMPARPYHKVPTPGTGPIAVLPDGTWLFPFEVNKHYDETRPWQHSSAASISKDRGKTWKKAIDIYTDPTRRIYAWDQRLAAFADGTLMNVFWTFDRQAAAYINIHARESRDGGKAWSEFWDTGVPGQPARPVRLPDGRIVMVYVDRTKAPVIKARLSSDGGRTFPDSTELVVHEAEVGNQTWKKGTMQDAWAEMAEFALGLPDATLLPNGDVLTVFYSGPKADETSVLFARISV